MGILKSFACCCRQPGTGKGRFWAIFLAGVTTIFLAGCRFSLPIIPGVPTHPAPTSTGEQSASAEAVEITRLSETAVFSATIITTNTPLPMAQGSTQSTATPSIISTPIPTQTVQASPTANLILLEIPEPAMGVETHSMQPAVMSALQTAGIQWARRNGLLWSAVEPVEGQRNWQAVASLESDLASASSHGVSTILIVRSTPLWAQKVSGHSCGPVREDKFIAFANFMKDLVARYSVQPFHVKYWEIGNEPDVDPSLVSADSIFGCWGDQNDPLYGGSYYARMLKAVYPAIKAADPQAKVLIGGLLLDCDPTHPPQGKDCKPSLFFKGILEGGGANYFDIVSFHGYANYNTSWESIQTQGTWAARGGTVLGKISYLRQVMNEYAVDKPIFETEGALNCPEGNKVSCAPPGDQFFETQADYAVSLFVRDWAAGLSGTIWYDFEGPGWRNGSMLDRFQKPKPVYNAFMFLLKELNGASYRREVTYYENVLIYEFSLPGKRVWVLWPADDSTHAVIPPGDVRNIYDKYGNPLTPADQVINLTSPVYFEFTP